MLAVTNGCRELFPLASLLSPKVTGNTPNRSLRGTNTLQSTFQKRVLTSEKEKKERNQMSRGDTSMLIPENKRKGL